MKAIALGLLAIGQLAIAGTAVVLLLLLVSALASAINRISKGRVNE